MVPARIVELGLSLIADAEQGYHENLRKNASVYRDGLQISPLALRPFRKRNFSGIRIGKRIRRLEVIIHRDQTVQLVVHPTHSAAIHRGGCL